MNLFGFPEPEVKKAAPKESVKQAKPISNFHELPANADKPQSFRLYAKPTMLLVTLNIHRTAKEKLSDREKRVLNLEKARHRTKTIEGVLSVNAQRKVRNAIRWLVAGSETKMVYEKRFKKKVPWRINMCTFTFKENMQDDKKAREIFSQWLEMAKYRFDMQLYIWLAEPQKRGAIHFHLSTNVYIPHTELRFTWNRLLRKHGFDNTDENSTDVHAVTNIENHEAYLCDYFLKEKKHEGRRAIKGKLWGCSHALSQAGKNYIVIDEIEKRFLNSDLHKSSLYKKLTDKNETIPDFLKFTDIFLTNESNYKNLPSCPLRNLYFDEVKKLRAMKQQKQLW